MARCRRQSVRKHWDGQCRFCGETDYSLLDAHRILPGAAGGKYSWTNMVTTCASCHRKIHAGRIIVHGRRQSTLGQWFLHYTEDGQEKWLRE